MKSKKKVKKSKTNKIRKEMDKITKRKSTKKQLKELKEVLSKSKGQEIREGIDALKVLMEDEKYINPHHGSPYYNTVTITTEGCGCTPEKGCLDEDDIHQDGICEDFDCRNEICRMERSLAANQALDELTKETEKLGLYDKEFKDHLVHNGVENLTCQQIEDAILSEELKALDKGWIGRFWEYIAGKIRKPLGF